jgi:ABC-type antimicrobial peptide transport system permease subunit
VSFLISSTIGFFLGFVFGVGCALAVMYSIFLGGYRAAVRDAELPVPPARLLKARAKLQSANTPKPL